MHSPTFSIGGHSAAKSTAVSPAPSKTPPSTTIPIQIPEPNVAAGPNSHAEDAAEAAT